MGFLQTWNAGDIPLELLPETPDGNVAPGAVDAWWCHPPDEGTGPTMEQFAHLTTQGERERAARFYFAADRWAFLSAQGLLRWRLALRLRCDPREIRFERNPQGRPFLLAPQPAHPIYFSLTHARGLVACAMSAERAIGVDVENSARDVKAAELAESYYAPEERSELRGLTPADQLQSFLLKWTLKEAFLKAIGMGLHAPIDSLVVQDTGQGLKTRFSREMAEPENGWAFWAASGVAGYHLAIAARTDTAKVQLRIGEVRLPHQSL